MRVGFIVTSPYQLFHFARIAQHLPSRVAYIEVREEDFGLSSQLVEKHLPDAEIVWVNTSHLSRLDGQCEVLVCQTPVPIMQFFARSLVVAQQYSLAKERYQYGAWRAQASMNLMYGPYSTAQISGFANAVAVGNPLLDDAYVADAMMCKPRRVSGRLRVLYMPTYGDLSNKRAVIAGLLTERIALTVKLHHAERELRDVQREGSVRIVRSDVDPIQLILDHDLVVSDYSGAIYDALAVRRPVLVVEGVNEASGDLHRLSTEDRTRSEISGFVGRLNANRSIVESYEEAVDKLQDDMEFNRYLERYFVNLGRAGASCAAQIVHLAENGEPNAFNVTQVRDTNRRYILENRQLRARLAALDGSSLRGRFRRLRAMPPRVAATKALAWGLRRTPGGDALLTRLRKVRARILARPLELPEHLGNVDRWSLPMRPIDRRRALLNIVVPALRRAGVDCRTHITPFNAYCAVRQADLDVVCSVLAELGKTYRPGTLLVWFGSGSHTSKPVPADLISLAALVEYESVTLAVPYTQGAYSVGRRGGVEVVFVEPRDTRIVAKRWIVEKTDWTEEFRSTDSSVRPRSAPVVHAGERKHVLENEPIDVVYTWVDSSDSRWRAAREACAAEEHIDLPAASNEERFINRDELKYSLRSVWLFAPFVRHIYIVTAGHRPKWLDLESDGVTIVPHYTIFENQADLPTFNSHAIEACLHRIPGLAEHFLYFNDDVFLGRETTIETFFTRSGLMKSRFSPSWFTTATQPGRAAIPTDWASYNAVQLMLRDFGIFFDRKLKHVPMPLKRSLLEEIEERYPEEVRRTRASRFRSRTDLSIPSMLAHYYGIATRRAVEWEGKPREYAYADTGRKDFLNRLNAIRRDKPTFICLNVTRHTDIALDRQAELLQQYLSEAYPVPSPYESAAAAPTKNAVVNVALTSTSLK